MLPKPIQRLAEFFLKFPGVGPRQAARFAFYILREEREYIRALADLIARLHDDVNICVQCYKTFDANVGVDAKLCELCRDAKRNRQQVLVVEKEVDLENIERTHKFSGLYHVLGGTIDPLDSSAPARLHMRELFDRVQKLALVGGVEIIIATNPTTEGDGTALYLNRLFAPLRERYGESLKFSRLGRGLSTGSELEYTDEMTIVSALENRK